MATSSSSEEAAISKLKYWSKNANPDKMTRKFEKSYLVDQDVELSKDVVEIAGQFIAVVKVKILSKSYDVEWIVDKCVSQCMNCSKTFSMLLRRHHCRLCGNIICDKCCSLRVKIEAICESSGSRICSACKVADSFEPSIVKRISILGLETDFPNALKPRKSKDSDKKSQINIESSECEQVNSTNQTAKADDLTPDQINKSLSHDDLSQDGDINESKLRTNKVGEFPQINFEDENNSSKMPHTSIAKIELENSKKGASITFQEDTHNNSTPNDETYTNEVYTPVLENNRPSSSFRGILKDTEGLSKAGTTTIHIESSTNEDKDANDDDDNGIVNDESGGDPSTGIMDGLNQTRPKILNSPLHSRSCSVSSTGRDDEGDGTWQISYSPNGYDD